MAYELISLSLHCLWGSTPAHRRFAKWNPFPLEFWWHTSINDCGAVRGRSAMGKRDCRLCKRRENHFPDHYTGLRTSLVAQKISKLVTLANRCMVLHKWNDVIRFGVTQPCPQRPFSRFWKNDGFWNLVIEVKDCATQDLRDLTYLRAYLFYNLTSKSRFFVSIFCKCFSYRKMYKNH